MHFRYTIPSLVLSVRASCALSFLSRAREVSLESVVYKVPQVLLVPEETMVPPATTVPR